MSRDCIVAEERWWLTADGTRAVKDGSPEARSLYAAPGHLIPREAALKLGILKAAEPAEDKASEPVEDKAVSKARQRRR